MATDDFATYLRGLGDLNNEQRAALHDAFYDNPGNATAFAESVKTIDLPENVRSEMLSDLKSALSPEDPVDKLTKGGPVDRFGKGASAEFFGYDDNPELKGKVKEAFDMVNDTMNQIRFLDKPALKASWVLLEPMLRNIVGQGASGNIAGASGAVAADTAMLGSGKLLALAKPVKAVSKALIRSAEKQFGKVLGTTKQIPKAIAETKVIPEAIERGIKARSFESLLGRTADELETSAQALDKAWKALPPDSMIDARPIYQELRDRIANDTMIKGTSIVENPELKRQYEIILAKLDEMVAQTGKKAPAQKALPPGPISGTPPPRSTPGVASTAAVTEPVSELEKRGGRQIFTSEAANPASATAQGRGQRVSQQWDQIETRIDPKTGRYEPVVTAGYVDDSTRIKAAATEKALAEQPIQISAESARRWRQLMDKYIASKPGGFAMTKPLAAEAEAKKVLTNAIRAQIASDYPSIAKINAEFSFWKNFNDIMSAKKTAQVGKDTPLGKRVVLAVGAASGLHRGGPTTAILDAALLHGADSLFKSTAWRTVSAAMKKRLADSLIDGKIKTTRLIIQKLAVNPLYQISELERDLGEK